MPNLLIVRQPIFNDSLDVMGYELLYHQAAAGANPAAAADPAAGPTATLKSTLERVSEVGLENLVAGKKAFVDVTRNYLVGKTPIPLPPGSVVLEVLDEMTAEGEAYDTLAGLTQQGYQLALDKVVSVNKVSKALGLFYLVKLDFPTLDRLQLADTVKRLKLHRAKLLANKVETLDDLSYCQRLGFDFYQGNFLVKPRIVAGRHLDTSRTVIMRSLAQIQDTSADFQSLAKIIAQDVSLSYKLLKLVNSAYYSLSKSITSLEQAVALIGLNQLRAWMTLLMMASVRNKPHELTTVALVRAKMCELLAKEMGERQTDPFFLVGLFSILDALMDLPLPEALASLPLADDIVNALVTHQGTLGELLLLVMTYERGQWESLFKLKQPVKPSQLGAAYLEAVRWTIEVAQVMNNA